MPPSSTPACWTLVTESAMASAFARPAGAAAEAVPSWLGLWADRARRSLSRRARSSAHLSNSAASSASFLNGRRVFCGGYWVAAAAVLVMSSAARARIRRDFFGMEASVVRYRALNGARGQKGFGFDSLIRGHGFEKSNPPLAKAARFPP